jgi:hypothetical protein
MMGLDLRHRYNKIRIQNGPGKPQVFHTRIRGARRDFAQLIPIQINKVDLPGLQLTFQDALNEDQVRVPLMAGSFSSAAAPTSTGFVFTSTPVMYSTRLGLSKTDLWSRLSWNRRSTLDRAAC